MSTAEAQIGVNTNLQKQDLSNLDISNLTALSPEVISRQATINIGTIGHVAHGKSTVVKAISGVQTVRFKNELERNITIKLERISYERLLKISKSPNLLREYEALQRKKLKRLQYAHPCYFRKSSIETNSCNYYQQQTLNFISTMRGNSTSPSSGYESLNDNASNYSGEHTQKSRIFKHKNTLTKPFLIDVSNELTETSSVTPKRNASSHACNSAGTPSGKRRKNKTNEYVVESIESLESINGSPVFFVKWLNYSSEQNTWESLSNLSECSLLETFIEQQYTFFETTISIIIADIEAQIERDDIKIIPSELNVQDLDKYDPLSLKSDLILLAQFRNARSRNQKEPNKIRSRVILSMLIKPFYYKRRKQLHDLKVWQKRMNEVEKAAPVSVENNVDLETLDMDFNYIKESFPGNDVVISENPPIGCKCENICVPSTKCCARMAGSYFAYDKNGRLRIRPGEAIYECNRTCACNINCVNRVIQRGRKNVLCLFKTPNGCGWGVRTERFIHKGEYVCEYVGEIITSEEANDRGKKYDAVGRTYLFDLDYNTSAESVYTIDAAMHGNISHFINHSCDPNLAVFPFWINNLDVNMPRLAFFTLRNIKPGEELSFDYIRTDIDANDYKNLSKAEKVSCRCGAANCRKVLF